MTSERMIIKGTRVVFSRLFLRSIGAFGVWHTRAAGEVRDIFDLTNIQLAEIAWDDGEVSRVNIYNLIPEDHKHLERA